MSLQGIYTLQGHGINEMPRLSQLAIARSEILGFFDAAAKKVYGWKELAQVLEHHRNTWKLARHTTARTFVAFLQKEGVLQEQTFRSERYSRTITRYSHGQPSTYEFAQSLNSRGYLSHASASALHGLTLDSKATDLYLNIEQSEKHGISAGELTQQGIDQAFSRRQRQSNLVYELGALKVTMVNGKNTDRLGVQTIVGLKSEPIRATSLERTLIDIAVRPSYAGGISRVLTAYNAAQSLVQTTSILNMLRRLDYVYPYHQAIGFLMERAGYSDDQLAPFKALITNLTFYLSHGIIDPRFDPQWKIVFPASLSVEFRKAPP